MNEIEEIKKDIQDIKQRNLKVESDKAWEISFSRKILIATLTYIVIVFFLITADFPKPFISAIVPTIGFVLSTLSIPFFRKLWIKLVYKNS